MTGRTRDYGGLRASSGGSAVGRFLVLAIGIDGYAHWPKLGNAERGAREISELLCREYGFERHCLLLGGEATRTAILTELDRLLREAGPEDSVVVVFCGHGHLDFGTKVGAWIPVEGKGLDDDGSGSAMATFVENNSIQQRLKECNACHVLVISDSCFAGDLVDRTPPETASMLLRDAHRCRSRQVLASGGLHAVTDEGMRGHSVFAHFLMLALRQARRDFVLPADLLDAVQRGVQGMGGEEDRQKPELGNLAGTGAQAGGQFVFFRRGRVLDSILDGTQVAQGRVVRPSTLGGWRMVVGAMAVLAIVAAVSIPARRHAVPLPGPGPLPTNSRVPANPPGEASPPSEEDRVIRWAGRTAAAAAGLAEIAGVGTVERELLSRLGSLVKRWDEPGHEEILAKIENALKAGDAGALVRLADERVDRVGVRRDLLLRGLAGAARVEGEVGQGWLARLAGLTNQLTVLPVDPRLLDEAEAKWGTGGEGALIRLATWWESRDLVRKRDLSKLTLESGLSGRASGDWVRPVIEDLIRELRTERGQDAGWVAALATRLGSGTRQEVEQTAAWWKEERRRARLIAAADLLRASTPDPSGVDPDFRFRRMASDLAGQDVARADQVAGAIEARLGGKAGRDRAGLGAWYAERFLPRREVDLMLVLDAVSERHPYGGVIGESIVLSLRSAMGRGKVVKFAPAGVRGRGVEDPAEEAALLGAVAVAKVRVVRAETDSGGSAVLGGSPVSRAVVEVEVTVGGRSVRLSEEVKEIRTVTAAELVRLGIEKALACVVWPPWMLNVPG